MVNGPQRPRYRNLADLEGAYPNYFSGPVHLDKRWCDAEYEGSLWWVGSVTDGTSRALVAIREDSKAEFVMLIELLDTQWPDVVYDEVRSQEWWSDDALALGDLLALDIATIMDRLDDESRTKGQDSVWRLMLVVDAEPAELRVGYVYDDCLDESVVTNVAEHSSVRLAHVSDDIEAALQQWPALDIVLIQESAQGGVKDAWQREALKSASLRYVLLTDQADGVARADVSILTLTRRFYCVARADVSAFLAEVAANPRALN